MSVIYSICLCFIGVFLYIKTKGKYIYHYILFWLVFAPPLFNVVANETQAEYHAILAWINYLGYIIYIIRLFRGELVSKIEKRVLMCIGIMILYACILSFVQNVSLVLKIKYIVSNFGFILYLTSFNQILIPKTSLLKLLRCILYIEIVLGLLQPFSNIFNFSTALEGDGVMTTYVNGTFVRNNIFIEFLTPLAILLIYEECIRKGKFTNWCAFISCIVLYLTFNTGVRTALIAIVPVILIVFYQAINVKIQKKTDRLLFVMLFLFALFTGFNLLNNVANNIGTTYTQNATSSLERQNVLASIINDENFASEQTTLKLSYDVLEYFSKSPITGPGLLFKGNGYAGYISMEAGNVTDATLAIYVCETGILGVIFFIYLYMMILRRGTRCTNLIFLYLLIVTIADPGLFFAGNVLLIFLSMKFGNELFNNKNYDKSFAKRFKKVL